mmetsp:Transcript_13876/g.29948  ORF Transcript_13876/g.29948 Transcript_13876/m.29948 type:complete len:100 (-) Transcript_13876:553-852(-)
MSDGVFQSVYETLYGLLDFFVFLVIGFFKFMFGILKKMATQMNPKAYEKDMAQSVSANHNNIATATNDSKVKAVKKRIRGDENILVRLWRWWWNLVRQQ